jgi:hypothetical protein
MYGQTARKAILRVLKEAPELTDLRAETLTWAKLKDQRSRKLADRLLVELWMMGFAVSARQPDDQAPAGAGGRDPEAHKAWRDQKLKPPPKDNQSDVEVQAQKPA